MGLKIGAVYTLLVGLPVLLLIRWLTPLGGYELLLLFLVILFGSMLVSWLLIDRPIRRLMQVMERAEQSGFLTRAAVRSRDFFGALSKSFNRLLERVTTLDAFKLERLKELSVITIFPKKSSPRWSWKKCTGSWMGYWGTNWGSANLPC